MPDLGLMNLALMRTEIFRTFTQIKYMYFNSFGGHLGKELRDEIQTIPGLLKDEEHGSAIRFVEFYLKKKQTKFYFLS